ncbi:hypothetical protein CC86DRAFT_382620 [Ophiobolus disseminans]|uniref:Heterokaryon incompatibility domain-containing protein n=1 Tax=Ophiobolus disseminans TaxID=1469910 RepID=A0A6A6ZY19_9PLEO|nr:hypothetical protein CC86DRAFT_382620 [Ophiobolus disseminans]
MRDGHVFLKIRGVEFVKAAFAGSDVGHERYVASFENCGDFSYPWTDCGAFAFVGIRPNMEALVVLVISMQGSTAPFAITVFVALACVSAIDHAEIIETRRVSLDHQRSRLSDTPSRVVKSFFDCRKSPFQSPQTVRLLAVQCWKLTKPGKASRFIAILHGRAQEWNLQYLGTVNWRKVLHHIFWTPPPLEDCAAFLQSWLWFGTLRRVCEIVGLTFRPGDSLSVTSENGSPPIYLSTKHLHRCFWYWLAAQSQISGSARQQQVYDIEECIQGVYAVLGRYSVLSTPGVSCRLQAQEFGEYVLDDEDTHILLAITVLAEAIDTAKDDVYRGLDLNSFSWTESLSVRQWLLEGGWCPNELTWLVNNFTISRVQALLFLCTIDRTCLGKDHSRCSITQCHFGKIDYNTYRPDHAVEGCDCADVSLSIEDDKKIGVMLRRGETPLIDIQVGPEGTRCVLHSTHPEMPHPTFVAISHVWSDRLGNLRENSLPACQLKRLQRYVSALYPTTQSAVQFWIDTMFIPRAMELRRLAINGMRSVYETAHKVLVLDRS